MKKKIIKYFFFVFLMMLSCKQRSEFSTQNYVISNRSFNFQNETNTLFKQQVTVMKKNDCKIFIYDNSETKSSDSLTMLNNSVIYNGVLLKKLDSKLLKIDGFSFDLDKYYLEDKKNYQGDCYFFINTENGILFTESLNSGTMTEYNVQKFKEIHKRIALKQLNFKDGEFELEFAKMDYKPTIK